MTNTTTQNYQDIFDLMKNKYKIADEDTNYMLSQLPEMEYLYKPWHLEDKLDLLLLYNANINDIISTPIVFKHHITAIEICCMLALLDDTQIDSNVLNSNQSFRVAEAIFTLRKNGKLPQDTSIFTPLNQITEMLDMNDDDFLYKYTISEPRISVKEQIKNLYPELYSKSRFLTLTSARKKLKPFDMRKKKLKAEIQQYFKERSLRGTFVKRCTHIVKNDPSDITYTLDPLLFANSLAEKNSKIIKNDYNDEDFADLVNQVSEYYGVPEKIIEERYNLFKTTLNMSRKEFIKKLEFSPNPIKESETSLMHSLNKLKNEYSNNQYSIKRIVLLNDNFPQINTHVLNEKIEALQKVGIPREKIEEHPDILSSDIERMTTRAQLAYLNNLYLNNFLKGSFRLSEEIVYARMKAKKDGLVDENKNIYALTNEELGMTNEELLAKYPFTQADLVKINYDFAENFKENPIWQNYTTPKNKTVFVEKPKSTPKNVGFVVDAKFSNDPKIQARVEEIAKVYDKPVSYLIQRQALCEDLFYMSKEEFFYHIDFVQKLKSLIQHNTIVDNLITSTDLQICKDKEYMKNTLQLSKEQILKIARKSYRFPYFNEKQIQARLALLEPFGITKEDVFNNIEALYSPEKVITTSLKIAFIKNFNLDVYLDKSYFLRELSEVFARMMAQKEKLVPNTMSIFASELNWRTASNYSTKELESLYPLTDESFENIDGLYNYFKNQGRTWKRGLQDEFGDTEKSTIKQPTKEIELPQIDEQPAIQKQPKENKQELKLSSDEILKLCTMFDCSPTKLQMLMKDPIFVAFCKENLKIENTDNNFTPDEM